MKLQHILWALILSSAMTGQTSQFAVRVQVVSSLTGDPIAEVAVTIGDDASDVVSGRTDAGGDLTVSLHSQGKHLLIASLSGYRMESSAALGSIIDVKSGDENHVLIKMSPLGVFAGRILDQYGDPVRNAIVRALYRPQAPGLSEDYESSHAAVTDDRGEYRLAAVEPGEYYIVAEYGDRTNRLLGGRSRFQWPEVGGYALFPEGTEISKARELNLGAGQTKRVDDLRLKMERAVTISGRVASLTSKESTTVTVARAGPRLGINLFAIEGGECDNKGNFTHSVLPGRYVITAYDRKSGRSSPPVEVDARAGDVGNVALKLSVTYQISGRFSIDGSQVLDYSKLHLTVGEPAKIGGDGSFRADLADGKAMYSLQGLPDDWFVEDVVVRGRHIVGRQFEVQPGTTDMSVVLNPRGGRLDVSISGSGSATPAFVVLLPEAGPVPDVESLLQAAPDPATGVYVARGVPPGPYRVFSLDYANWPVALRPDLLMERHRNLAPLVQVGASDHKSISASKIEIPQE
jgi:hypothetical protein